MSEGERTLAWKRKIRAGHRASATRILGQVEPALAETPVDIDRLSQLKRMLEDKLETLKLLDGEVVEATPEEGIEDEIQQADEYNERLYSSLSKINNALKPPPMHATVRATSRSPEAGAGSQRQAKVKLPKLSLPHFNGNPMKWTSFWDS